MVALAKVQLHHACVLLSQSVFGSGEMLGMPECNFQPKSGGSDERANESIQNKCLRISAPLRVNPGIPCLVSLSQEVRRPPPPPSGSVPPKLGGKPSHPVQLSFDLAFSCLVVGCPFTPLKAKLLAGDLGTAQKIRRRPQPLGKASSGAGGRRRLGAARAGGVLAPWPSDIG